MKKSTLILLAALAAAAIASYVLFKPSDQLKELKKTAEATEGQEELFRLVREIAAAARKPDAAKRLAPFMLIRDRAELERITEPLTSGPDLGELKFLGCTKLAVRNAAAPETWGTHVWSANRKQGYAFYFRKDAKGAYKLSEIGLSDRKP